MPQPGPNPINNPGKKKDKREEKTAVSLTVGYMQK
jgi:hypothetical protein